MTDVSLQVHIEQRLRMSDPVTIWVEGHPRPQGSMIVLPGGRMRHHDKHLRPWRKAIAWAATIALREAGRVLFSKPAALSIRLEFYMPTLKASQPRYCTKVPDIDKLIRAVLDALTGALYEDDCQVVRLSAGKSFTRSTMHPREPGVMIQAIELR